jgi:hypothetical protein
MSTFTKEQLIEKLQHRISVASGFPESEKAQMDLELARIALASLEAEPVAYIFKHPAGRLFWSLTDESNKGQSDVMPVYTDPPAPVSVPDEIRLLQSEVTIWKDRWELLRELFREIADKLGCDVKDHEAMLDKIEMLQGAEHVTTANKLPFEQWISQQTGTIDVECGCVMTEVFFHWLRVAYEAGNYPVIPDGWVACSERMPEKFVEVLVCTEDGSRYVAALNQSMNWDDGDFFDDIQYVTHWMPLPAAPQQEVK